MADDQREAASVGFIGSLNGVWQRARVLFGMSSGGSVPPGLTPVWIAGDSREPCGLGASYRRFSIALSALTPAANAAVRLRADAAVVLTRIAFQNSAAAAVHLQFYSPAFVSTISGWVPLGVQQGGWTDSPDGSPLPLSQVTSGGAVGDGNTVSIHSTASAYEINSLTQGAFLPRGSGIGFFNNSGSTLANLTVHVEGYLRGL